MLVRLSAAALVGTLALAPLGSSVGAATSAPNPNPTLIPLLEVRRLTSADRAFIERAIDLALATMDSSNHEISLAGTVDVQDEAVRAFNTAAAAYNGLADVASKRAIPVAKPKASTLDETPGLAQDARPSPQDLAFVSRSRADLERAVALYRAEIRHGKDPLAVAFATRMQPRLARDLELVDADLETIDRAKTVASPMPEPSSSP